jgi:hypothetical protein
VLALLKDAWINERRACSAACQHALCSLCTAAPVAPELLPYQEDLVLEVQDVVKRQVPCAARGGEGAGAR